MASHHGSSHSQRWWYCQLLRSVAVQQARFWPYPQLLHVVGWTALSESTRLGPLSNRISVVDHEMYQVPIFDRMIRISHPSGI